MVSLLAAAEAVAVLLGSIQHHSSRLGALGWAGGLEVKLTCRPGEGMSRSAVKISTDADVPGATVPAHVMLSVTPSVNMKCQDGGAEKDVGEKGGHHLGMPDAVTPRRRA